MNENGTAPARPPAPKAPEPKKAPPQPAAPRTHTVWIWQETGDCLWTLAKQYYGDPWLWKKIYLANRDKIADPAVIYPKQVLVIPPLDDSER
jgi:nucleoid-associated protein YgaU